MDISIILNIIATIIFAVDGSLIYLQFGNSIILTMLFAVMTSVGGGTIRDLILKKKVFWMNTPYIIIISVVSSLITYKIFNK